MKLLDIAYVIEYMNCCIQWNLSYLGSVGLRGAHNFKIAHNSELIHELCTWLYKITGHKYIKYKSIYMYGTVLHSSMYTVCTVLHCSTVCILYVLYCAIVCTVCTCSNVYCVQYMHAQVAQAMA